MSVATAAGHLIVTIVRVNIVTRHVLKLENLLRQFVEQWRN